MLHNHRAASKYYKAGTWSVMSLHYIKGTVLLTETMNYDIYIPFTLVHILRIPFCNLRTDATTLPYLNLCRDTLPVY